MASESGGKRGRDPEEEVYVDNLHNHKRYLSEMMACSLNGLTVEDSISENHGVSVPIFDPMDSPARSDIIGYARDEFSSPYSPMSEDDDCRYDPGPSTLLTQTESLSTPTSPVSSYKWSSKPYPTSNSCVPSSLVSTSQPKQRASDSEGRFPPSPSDICHSSDLRRTALLRSVQLKAQPPSAMAIEIALAGSSTHQHLDYADHLSCHYMKDMLEEKGSHHMGQQPDRGTTNRARTLLMDESSAIDSLGNHSMLNRCRSRKNAEGDESVEEDSSGEDDFEGEGGTVDRDDVPRGFVNGSKDL